MIELPDKSKTKCIGNSCNELPEVVLVGQHEEPYYQIQIRACKADLPTARKVAQERYPNITFKEEVKPNWLKKAQEKEIGLRKSNT